MTADSDEELIAEARKFIEDGWTHIPAIDDLITRLADRLSAIQGTKSELREKVARIIDPESFREDLTEIRRGAIQHWRDIAFAKADAILALLPAPVSGEERKKPDWPPPIIGRLIDRAEANLKELLADDPSPGETSDV